MDLDDFGGVTAGLAADRGWTRRVSWIIRRHRLAGLVGTGLRSIGPVSGTWFI